MKLYSIFVITSLLSSIVSAQIKFEQGYYLDEKGIRVECLIKNKGITSNSKRFTFKKSAEAIEEIGEISTVSEYGIIGKSTYKRFAVNLDLSGISSVRPSNSRSPEFVRDTIYLKEIITGNASLFLINEISPIYFLVLNESEPEQLIFKAYLASNGKVQFFELFKQQLTNALTCNLNEQKIKTISYSKKHITDLILDHNTCMDANWKPDVDPTKRNNKLNIWITPGINKSSVDALFAVNDQAGNPYLFSLTSRGTITYSLGTELEFVWNFGGDRFSFLLQPSYQSLNIESTTVVGRLKYNSLQIPIGFRGGVFPFRNQKLFLDALFVTAFPFKSKFEFLGFNKKVLTVGGFAFDVGYGYKRLRIQYRYTFKYSLASNSNQTSDIQTTSVWLGYKINK